jgi:hypothetical protein
VGLARSLGLPWLRDTGSARTVQRALVRAFASPAIYPQASQPNSLYCQETIRPIALVALSPVALLPRSHLSANPWGGPPVTPNRNRPAKAGLYSTKNAAAAHPPRGDSRT